MWVIISFESVGAVSTTIFATISSGQKKRGGEHQVPLLIPFVIYSFNQLHGG
jgi:hypothetical protein